MPEVNADPLDRLRERTSVKWRMYPDDVLPLFVAEMDYPLAPVVARAMIERIEASDTGYIAGPADLGAAYAGFAARTWGWTVDPSSLRTAPDVSVAIVETLRRAIEPGDLVVITPPVYPPFFDLVAEAGGALVEVPLLEVPLLEVPSLDAPSTDVSSAGSREIVSRAPSSREPGVDAPWSLDLDGIERAFAQGARAMLLCHPHNPLGLVHSREQLVELAELADRYGATIVSDEIHAPLVHRGVAFSPFLSVSDAARRRGVCVTSASKAWNLAGVKCAIIVAASEPMLALVDSMPVEVGFRTSILGLHASIAAFDSGVEWLDAAIAAIESNRDLLGTLLAEHLPRVGYRPPAAGYLAWLDFRDAGWGDDPSIRALEVGRVALNPGPTFGAQGRAHVRLNLACSPAVLTEAIERLAAAAPRP